jgi:hypothetical protein
MALPKEDILNKIEKLQSYGEVDDKWVMSHKKLIDYLFVGRMELRIKIMNHPIQVDLKGPLESIVLASKLDIVRQRQMTITAKDFKIELDFGTAEFSVAKSYAPRAKRGWKDESYSLEISASSDHTKDRPGKIYLSYKS